MWLLTFRSGLRTDVGYRDEHTAVWGSTKFRWGVWSPVSETISAHSHSSPPHNNTSSSSSAVTMRWHNKAETWSCSTGSYLHPQLHKLRIIKTLETFVYKYTNPYVMHNKCYSWGFFHFHFPSIRIADVKNYMPTTTDVAASCSFPGSHTHGPTYKNMCTYSIDTNTQPQTHNDLYYCIWTPHSVISITAFPAQGLLLPFNSQTHNTTFPLRQHNTSPRTWLIHDSHCSWGQQ